MKRAALLAACLIVIVAGCRLGTATDRGGRTDNSATTTGSPDVVIAADKILDLSRRNLSRVEMSVFDKTYLEELNLSGNKLTGALPSQIGQLRNLRVINASNNLMTGVPAEIGQLSNLEVLDFSNNRLTGLPNELANLKKLKILNLAGNNYSEQDMDVIRNSLPNVQYILR